PAGSISGLPSSLGAVLDVGGTYNANWLLSALDQNGQYQPALDFFNSYPNHAGFQYGASVGGAFYYTAATVADPAPEPATLTLLGIGIVSVAGCGWRRKRQQAIA